MRCRAAFALIVRAGSLPGLLLVLATAAAGSTYVVDPYGTGDFPTIQAAVAAADDGDIIALTDGTFTGDGNRDVNYRGKAITIRSQGGNPETCIIDCEGSLTTPHRAFHLHCEEGPTSVLAGVTITGGYGPHYQSWWAGGGVHCVGSAPTITDCVFSDNYSREFGAAISCWHNASPTIVRCTFTSNVADNRGAGIFCYDSDATITDCIFAENSAENFGAGLHCLDASPSVTGCMFRGNMVSRGAGISCVTSAPSIANCTFYHNLASASGGGVYCYRASPGIVSCTFVDNAAPAGGGVFCEGSSSPTIENSIFAFATAGAAVSCNGPSDEPTLTCCDIYANAWGDWVGCIEDQYGIDGNISEDPLFCDPENRDFSIDCGSPCAPFSPPNPECDLIGASSVGCGGTPTIRSTWGGIKSLFRN
jgi:hypothetical protein